MTEDWKHYLAEVLEIEIDTQVQQYLLGTHGTQSPGWAPGSSHEDSVASTAEELGLNMGGQLT